MPREIASDGPEAAVLPQQGKPAARKGKVDILNGKITPTLWEFSLPLMVSFVVNMLYSLTDTYFVSRLGSASIAAIGVCEQIGFFIFTLGSGIAVGSGVILARRLGEGRKDQAALVSQQALTLTALAGLAITALIFTFMEPIFSLFSLTEAVHDQAVLYLSMLILGSTSNFLVFQISTLVRSSGDVVFPMSMLLLTVLANAVLAPLLIFGVGPFPEMGIAGAGLATALAQTIGVMVGLRGLKNGKAGFPVTIKPAAPDAEIIRSIFKMGIPSTAQMLSVSLTRMVLFKIAAAFGTSAIAAYTLGLKVDFFVYMPVFAVGVALQTFTGQHLGANKVRRIFEFYRAAVFQLAAFTIALTALAFVFGEQYARLFTNDPEVVQQTVEYLRIVSIGYPLFLITIASTRIVSGAGAAVLSMTIIAGISFAVQLPAAWLLSSFTSLGEHGVWWGIVIGHGVMAITGHLVVMRKKWIRTKF